MDRRDEECNGFMYGDFVLMWILMVNMNGRLYVKGNILNISMHFYVYLLLVGI